MELIVAVTDHATRYVARCLDVDIVSHGGTVDGGAENREEALGAHFIVGYALDSLELSLMAIDLIRA